MSFRRSASPIIDSVRLPRVVVNGTPLATRLASYGGRGYLGVRKEVLQAAGIAPGDSVDVVLELDEGEPGA
jgi:Domain of unknown function (DUF1905)